MWYKYSSRLSSAAIFPIHLHTLGRNAVYRTTRTVSMSFDVCIQQGSRYSTSYTSILFLAFNDVVWCIICIIDFFKIISSECRPLTPPSHFNILTRVLRHNDLARAVPSETPVGQP